jgi:hypothetical protein
MFKGIQKLFVNFGANLLLANAFTLLIMNENTVKSFLLAAIDGAVKPGSINFMPGDSDAEKKLRLLQAAGFVITAVFDYLILNQETIKTKLETVIKV